MSEAVPHITICICTFQRPALLRRLLTDLAAQETQGRFTISMVVADNDPAESARPVVEDCCGALALGIDYVVEPRRSISQARNKSLEPAKGRYIAFIDDDEFPAPNWLLTHYLALTEHKVDGVFGPVRPHYDPATPDWVKKAGFYERPEHDTGFPMPWQECRTGNVLIDRNILTGLEPVFRPQFGNDGEDRDLFRRLKDLGRRFIWCNEAVVYEVVPLGRCQRRFLIRRALLRGGNSLRHPKDRLLSIAKAIVAVPGYALALPFLQLKGHHLFMLYCVKLFDHLGRLLAICGFHPVRVREMQ